MKSYGGALTVVREHVWTKKAGGRVVSERPISREEGFTGLRIPLNE